MKKFGIICAGLAVALAAQTAKAQVVDTNDGLSIWYDNRATAAAIVTPTSTAHIAGTSVEVTVGKAQTLIVRNTASGNGGGPGDGQTLFVSPRLPVNPAFQPTVNLGLHWVGIKNKAGTVIATDYSRRTLYKYMTVESRGGTGEVIGALGLTTNITKGGAAGVGNKIENVTVAANGALWNGNTNVVASAGDNWSVTNKSVKVPVSAGPVYNTSGGAVPSATPYQLQAMTVTANVWQKGIAITESTYGVKDAVNNLLVTRVVSTGSLPPEEPDFGYTTDYVGGNPDGTAGSLYRSGSFNNANLPEANSGGDGLTIGTTSVQNDATIVLQTKADFNNDGLVTGGDVASFNAALGAGASLRQRELFLGDLNDDGSVTGGDVAGFNNYLGVLAAGSCAVPANCP